jgi:hypothetical protein
MFAGLFRPPDEAAVQRRRLLFFQKLQVYLRSKGMKCSPHFPSIDHVTEAHAATRLDDPSAVPVLRKKHVLLVKKIYIPEDQFCRMETAIEKVVEAGEVSACDEISLVETFQDWDEVYEQMELDGTRKPLPVYFCVSLRLI